MKLEPQDWQALRIPLTIFGVVILLVLGLAWFADDVLLQSSQALQQQKSQMNQARQKLFASGTERDVIIKYLPKHQQLTEQGVLGDEHRIEWIHHVNEVNRQFKLFGVRYSIGAQEDYKPLQPLNSGPFMVRRSQVKVESPLLHEGDLFTLLEQVFVGPLFVLHDCVLTRISAAEKNKFVPNLNAACEADMLTIVEPKTGGQP